MSGKGAQGEPQHMLLLDVGNSACKWRLTGGEVRNGSAYHGGDWTGLMAGLPVSAPARVVVASVAGAVNDARIAEAVTARWKLHPEFVISQRETLGVTNAYAEPARLGVDRWLGVVEAYASYGASIVIDSGSALTIDAVTADGRHLGGYIVPGLGMMWQGLVGGTAAVRPALPAWKDVAPGAGTDAAVSHGILRMTVAFVAEAVVALESELADTCTTIMTGGDAQWLLPWLDKNKMRHLPELVLDGLERVARTATKGM